MNFVQQLEESLRDLAAEARKHHPGVKEASERATWTLRQYKNAYASEVRKANAGNSTAPTTKMFQSSELLHPFLLAANYPNASPELLEISFRAMRLLLENDAVLPNDAIHLVRVWMIQAQVVATHFQKHSKPSKRIPRNAATAESYDKVGGDTDAHPGVNNRESDGSNPDAYSKGGSGSWFFWSSSSTSSSTTKKNAESTSEITFQQSSSSEQQPQPAGATFSVVSSSTGQAGHASTATSKEMEKLALDILSSLSLLMQEMFRRYPTILGVDTVLWKHSFGVLCLCLSPFMNNSTFGAGSSSTASSSKNHGSSSGSGGSSKQSSSLIQQAAHSTFSQILALLYEPITTSASNEQDRTESLEANETFVTLRESTWQDLLSLSQAPAMASVSSLHGAFALCKTTVPSSTFSGSTFTNKRSTPTPVPVPPSPTMALQALTKLWRNSDHKLSDKLATDTLLMTIKLLRSVQSTSKNSTMSSVEATYSVLHWTSLVLGKLSDSNFPEYHDAIKVVLELVAAASESCRQHPDFEDGFVYSREFAFSLGGNDVTTMSTSRSSMTQVQSQNQQEQQTQQSNEKPLIPSATLGKASLALDVTYRLVTNEKTSAFLMRDPAIVGLLVEALSDFATLAASCEVHIIQLVEFVKSRGGEEGQEQQQQQQPVSFIRKLEQGVDNNWDSLVDSSTLGEAVFSSISGVIRTLENVCSLSEPSKKAQVLEIFAPSLAVLQHYLKRFSGNDTLVHLALEGYGLLAKLCFPSLDMQKALLTSLCKLSLPSWGKRDHSALMQDHHVDILLCVVRIMHTYHPHIANDWEVVLMTLEELSALSIASPMLSDEAYHSALAVASIYGRVAAFSTCLTPNSLIQMVQALCHTIATSLDDPIFLSDTGKNAWAGSLEPGVAELSSKAESLSISERLMKAGVNALYGSSSGESSTKPTQPTQSNRTRNRYYEEYRRDFLDRISKSKNPIRVESLGRVPFALALLADIAMANSYRYKECGERISGLMSDLAASSAAVRPFLMDTVALLTMIRISNSEESPAPFIGPGKLVFDNPMQSQLLAVERADNSDDAASMKKSAGDISQTELLGPLCDSLQSASKSDVAEASLETLHSVLETTGTNLSDDAWVIVINALSSLSGDPSISEERASPAWSKCSMDSFRCLKLIVNDFIDDFPANTAALISLLDCCSSFGSSRHDVNTSLTAIGLLWTIADRDSGSDSVDRALSKLVFLAADSRPEVRNASVNTLFSCIAGRGSGFSADRWQVCVQGTIFEVYEAVSRKARGEDPETTPNTPGNRKSSRYQVSLHHSRDSESKQWIATQVVVLRGLTRVLRTFFKNLLETTDVEAMQPENAKKDDVPWFQDAWVQILDYAYEAAAQGGSRDTLDIRSIGIDLLILCCQLSSKGGIKATSPARVGTNMEVVDGALRTVRDSAPQTPPKPAKAGVKSHKRSHSMICESSRKNFFIEAYESLESYIEFLENVPKAEMDDTQLQVVHRFCTGLKSLYDGSKEAELRVDNKVRCIECFVESESEVHVLPSAAQIEDGGLEKDFGKHLVTLVASTVTISTADPTVRYLNQAQRGCLHLLKAMAADGSCDSLRYLVRLGSIFFFVKDLDKPDEGKSESLGLEAVSVLAEALQSAATPAECKCLVVSEVLSTFLHEGKNGLLANRQKHQFKIDYKRLIPIVTIGLEAGIVLENELRQKSATDSPSFRLVESCWTSLTESLSIMIAPISMGGDGIVKMSRVGEVMELVKFIVPRTPKRFASALCETLVLASSSCLEVAELHERCSIKHADKDVASKSKKHRDELLELFSACFAGCCKLRADSLALRNMSKTTLEGAVNVMFSSGDDGESYVIEASIIICKHVRSNEGVDVLLPAIFPSLCRLIAAKDDKVRSAVAETLGAEKTANFLQNAENRRQEAIERAKHLSETLDEQRAEIQRLKRDLAVLESSPNL